MTDTSIPESAATPRPASLPREEGAVLPWARTCYGVDHQADGLVVVRAQRSRRGAACAWRTVPGPFPGGDKNDVPVVACLRARAGFTRRLEAPFAPAKSRKVFPTLLDVQLPFALEECLYCLVDVRPTPAGATSGLAVVARRADVAAVLEEWNGLGMDPVVLDHEGLAAWTRSLDELPPVPGTERRARAVLVVDADTSLLAIGRGREFLSAHRVSTSDTGQMDRLVKAALQSSVAGEPDEAVDWHWAGPDAANGGLQAELLRCRPGTSQVHEDPRTFLARAMATRALGAGPLRCNLRLGDLAHPRLLRRERRRSVQTAMTVLFAGILLCVASLGADFVARTREARVEAAFNALRDRLAGYSVRGALGTHAISIVVEETSRSKKSLQPFRDALAVSLAEHISAVMGTGARDDLRYDLLSITRDGVTVSGTAGDWNRCGNLQQYLQRSGYGVSLQRRDAMADERVPFTITTGEQDG